MANLMVNLETDHSVGDRVCYQDQEHDTGTVASISVRKDATGYDTWSIQVLYRVRWDKPVKTPTGVQVETEHPSESLCWAAKRDWTTNN